MSTKPSFTTVLRFSTPALHYFEDNEEKTDLADVQDVLTFDVDLGKKTAIYSWFDELTGEDIETIEKTKQVEDFEKVAGYFNKMNDYGDVIFDVKIQMC